MDRGSLVVEMVDTEYTESNVNIPEGSWPRFVGTYVDHLSGAKDVVLLMTWVELL